MNLCPNCGEPLVADAKFCEDCGASVISTKEKHNDLITPHVDQPLTLPQYQLEQKKRVGILFEYINMWKNYVNFSDRTNLRGFWMAFLFNFIVAAVLSFIPFANGLYCLAAFLPSVAIGIRRLRDAGKHWCNIFWNFIPIIGTIVYIVLLCRPSLEDDGVPVV